MSSPGFDLLRWRCAGGRESMRPSSARSAHNNKIWSASETLLGPTSGPDKQAAPAEVRDRHKGKAFTRHTRVGPPETCSYINPLLPSALRRAVRRPLPESPLAEGQSLQRRQSDPPPVSPWAQSAETMPSMRRHHRLRYALHRAPPHPSPPRVNAALQELSRPVSEA